ncbi:MAG: DUF86 domain-containing protein [Selenomonadaceae bacterium]|nr:DUF86 domain-containing protein [Selenomonadaceae bacterium]
MRGRRGDRIILQKIIEYCAEIEGFITRFDASYEIYLSDKGFRYACDMCVLQIGELTKRLSDDFKAQNSEIMWHAIKGMRNVLVHEYEKIDLYKSWVTLTQRVPELKAQLEQILAEGEYNENHDE